jgi:3'-phosphoadenosine 5'-phosphosulfate sulfotransferase (PAPS reductase)/FAD synthetase
MKKNLLVCRSGGRTSEYMYKRLLSEYSEQYNIVGIFANTGWEHHKTLEFVHNNDLDNEKLFGVKPVWVEAVVHQGRVSCTHKLVTYETASRNREPFVEVVKKYGVPNKAYPHCTRELKEHPIHDYVTSVLGWSNTKKDLQPYSTALGIRIDEPRRLKSTVTPQNKVYPLAHWFDDTPDKLDILDWWEDYHFDLGIPEHLGNCVGCFRKSDRKALRAYRDAPEQFVNTMEADFGHIGHNKINGVRVDEPRTMYRNYKTCQDIIQMFKDVDQGWLNKDDPDYMNEGCASSCEPFAG